MLKLMKTKIIENLKTLFFALIIALIIRSFFFQPFYIPSSSMEPNLLVGDRIFVSKFSYGYSRHSFPFSPTSINTRVFFKQPNIGDVIVFKTPADNRTDYIKRLIGLPGDSIEIIDGIIYLNDEAIKRNKVNTPLKVTCGNEEFSADTYEEILPNGKKYLATYRKDTMQNTDKYIVPANHYFFMGDNRDCSKDSRFLSSVGYVNSVNLVGKAKIVFFSTDKKIANFLKFWMWNKSIRFNRIMKKI
jgi:signal peptidase I